LRRSALAEKEKRKKKKMHATPFFSHTLTPLSFPFTAASTGDYAQAYEFEGENALVAAAAGAHASLVTAILKAAGAVQVDKVVTHNSAPRGDKNVAFPNCGVPP
jgi:hypothetical protein